MTIERIIPAGVERELNREESAEIYLVFLTITHDNLPEPIRVVSDPKDFTLDGETFIGFPFTISMLSDTESPPEAELEIQNVDQKIGRTLLDLIDPARLKLEIIAGSEFDLTVDPRTPIDGTMPRVYVADSLYLVDVEVDVLAVKGRLRTWDYAQEVWPGTLATKDRFPGLYR